MSTTTLEDLIMGTTSEADVSSHPIKTQEQLKKLNDLMNMLFGDIGNYQGGQPLSKESQAYQDTISKLLPVFGDAGSTIQNLLKGDATDFTQVYKDSVENPLLKDFKNNIMPSISRKYGGNFFGSDRQKADDTATKNLFDTLSSERSKFAFNSLEAAKNRQIGALNTIPGIAAGVGGLADVADFQSYRDNQDFAKRMQIINALLSATGQQTIENIGVVTPGQSGALQGFLEALGKGAGAAAAA